MKVETLRIKNFRGIRSLTIDFHDRMNVFIGENGSGKSAILDLLAIMLSRLIGRIRSESGTGRSYSEWDITNGESETDNEIAINLNGERVGWRFTKARLGRRQIARAFSNFEQIKPVVRQFQDGFERDENQSLPVCVHYGVNRTVLDIPLRIRTRHPFDQLSTYQESLTGGASDFRRFFEWYRNREDIENEELRRRMEPSVFDSGQHDAGLLPDLQLEAVRTAIGEFLPDFSNLTVRRKPRLRMTIEKNAEVLVVNQLSDGEKCTLALVGDLARRLAIANPSLKDPLMGYGVVMIDEIDLHLHPRWQRMIVPGLQRTFPNCQFILTTHSPQVLSHVRDVESVFALKKEGMDTLVSHPASIYGMDSNRILEDSMNVPDRPREIQEQMDELFSAIDKDDLPDAQRLLDQLRETIGSHPELTKAQVLIHRKEVLGR